MSSMEALNINPKEQESFESLEQQKGHASDWESWEHLKLSAYHGRKLTRRSYKSYHPKVEEKTFFLHQLDNYGFEPEEKLMILMRTFKKLFGSVAGANTSKGRKFNTKLTFLRERGKRHFAAGKKVTDLIAFPDSYWEAFKEITEAKYTPKEPNKGFSEKVAKRPRLELDSKSSASVSGVQTRQRKTA